MLALAICTSAQNRNVAFYRNVHIDDRQYQFVCKDEIPAEISRQTKCYRVEFNTQGRVSRIQYTDRADIHDVSIVYSDSAYVSDNRFKSNHWGKLFYYLCKLFENKINTNATENV